MAPLHLLLCLAATCCLVGSLVLSASAEQQQTVGAVQNAQETLADLAAAASNNYDQQQQQQQHSGHGSKAKKIQIVYIKVPLAKLRPSLQAGASNDNYGNSSSSSLAAVPKVEQQTYETSKYFIWKKTQF